MKKNIFTTLFLIGLLCGVVRVGYTVPIMPVDAFTGAMRIDGRDKYNNPIEVSFVSINTVFSRFYAILSPFGVSRWRLNSDVSAAITNNKNFILPRVEVPFLYNDKDILLSIRYLFTHQIPNGLIFLLLTFLMLCHISFFQSKNEPRFRLPVLIE